jgi:putative ABC transport system permease protein
MTDLRYAFRLLRKSYLFTCTVVLTLTIGIGATAAIFSVVHAVLLRPLPFAEPDRLMQIAEKNDALNLPAFSASALNYLSWKEQTQTFAELGAIKFGTFTLSGQGDPETYTGNAITPSVMPLLGLQPTAGRTFVDGDDKPGAPPVALISESLWRRRFGGDPAVLGRPATLNGVAHTVIGIAPRALGVLTTGDIWVPLVIDPPKELRLNHVLFVVGRLKPGVAVETARAEMDAVAARVAQQYPEVKDWGINLVTFTDTFVSTQLRTALLVLLGAVTFVLLIVSANVANLLLSRALERQKEMAVRAALGAGRARLVRQLLVESLVLSSVGGAAGIAVAAWAVTTLESTLPPNLLPVPDIGLNQTVVLFAVGLTLLTGVVFGLAPAWQGSTIDVNATLKATGRSSSGGVRPLLRKGLACGEFALATVLLIAAALLVRSLLELQRVPLGFDTEHVLSFQVSLPPTKYPGLKRVPVFESLREALNTVPGVKRAAVSSGIPFGVGNYTTSPVTVPGKSALPPGTSVPIDWRLVSPGFFETMRIPMLRGRDFTTGDTATAPAVMIVSRATARALWGDEDPVGRTVRRVADAKDFTVIGVVGDVRSTTLNRESPALYYSSATATWPLMDYVVRTTGEGVPVLPAIRQKLRELDPEVPLMNVRPMAEWISTSAAQPRLNAALLGVFACVALLVAAIGAYGVLAYSVSQRTRELGVRMALGADRKGVLGLILREGMSVGLIGIAIGVASAAALSQALSALVFGVSVWDPFTYVGVPSVLTLVALVSCAVPALRAARVDPIEALRLE